MFGFVKPFIPNLRVKEYEYYRSVYCGLCRSMKRHTGEISRATLSYDMTFFALLRLALSGEDISIRRKRCAAHPMRARPMMCDNASLEYAAYISAILVYYKLQDTRADEHGAKKLGAAVLSPCASAMRRRSMRVYETADSVVGEAMREISSLEKERCPIPDMPADCFGRMLGTLLACGLETREAAIAQEIGLHTGRWVYLADAVCDYPQDKKSGSYNPFLYAFPEEAQMEDFRRTMMRGVLSMETDAIARSVLLIDFEDRLLLRRCIENIIEDGMESALSMAVGKEKTDGEGSL